MRVVFSHILHNNFCVTTQNGSIDVRDVIKYLGAMIDFKLTWKFVVQKLCVSCLRNIEQNKTLCITISFEKCIFRLSSSAFVFWGYNLWKCCFKLHSQDTSPTKLHYQNYYSYIIFQNKTIPSL